MCCPGREGYEVTAGSVTFCGTDLLAMDTEERARAGLFLAFQYPVEIPGVSNMEFLKAAVDAVREHRGEPAVDAGQLHEASARSLQGGEPAGGAFSSAASTRVSPAARRSATR
jgi:Fe-S cluster assembly ATPase SufC